MLSVDQKIHERFLEKKWTLSFAESCTGGNLSASLVQFADCSHYFLGSIIAYSNFAKQKFLGVDEALIQEKGAISKECVEVMALGAKKAFDSTFALSVSGIAGPSGGSEKKPIGTIWFSLVAPEKQISWEAQFGGDRHQIIQQATEEALFGLWNHIS